MLPLRWTLGVVTAIVIAGLLAIAVIGGNLRRSFGASDSPVPILIILVGGGLVLASLAWPGQRLLQHLVAVLMTGLAIGAMLLARRELGTGLFGVAYAAAWLSLYVRLLRT